MKNQTDLVSKSNIYEKLFPIFGALFCFIWMLSFINFIIFADGYNFKGLLLFPVLLIPFWIFLIIQDSSNSLVLTDEGIVIFKFHFIKFKKISWKNMDYFFSTFENGRVGKTKVFYIVSNKKLILSIDETRFKNMNEMIDLISSKVEYRGFVKSSFLFPFFYFLNQRNKNLP